MNSSRDTYVRIIVHSLMIPARVSITDMPTRARIKRSHKNFMRFVVGTTIFIEQSLSTDNEILFLFVSLDIFYHSFYYLFNNFFSKTFKIAPITCFKFLT